ncbi:MAG: beta strand repeat-containing protein, partial [Paracoccus sp. (in: a-proteobacteria)]
SASDLLLDGNLNLGDLVNSGSITVDDGQTLTSADVAENTGTLEIDGDFTGAIDNEGAVDISGTGTVTGDVANLTGGSLNNEGSITGDVANNANASLASSGTITGNLDNDGSATLSGDINGNLTNDGSLELDNGTITGSVINNAQTSISGSSSITGDLTNGGTISGTGGSSSLTVSNGTFLNDGTLTTDGSSTLSIMADDLQFGQNSLVDGDRVLLNGNITNHGDLIYDDAATLNGGGLINAANGDVTISAAVDGNNYNITNHGDFLVTTDANSDGDLHNVNIINNYNNFAIDPDGSVSATLVQNHNGGTMTVSGTLTSTGDGTSPGIIRNLDGGVLNLTDGELNGNVHTAGTFTGSGTINGALTINDGTATVPDGDTLLVTDIVHNQGQLEIAGMLDTSELNNGTAGSVSLAGGSVTGNVINNNILTGSGLIAGNLINRGEADLGGTVGGHIENTGTLGTNGNLDVASLTNNNTVNIDTGDTLTSASEVDNRLTLNVSGTLDGDLNNHDTATTTLNNGTLDGDVNNAGTLTGTGDITGTLTNTSHADIAGSANIINNSGDLLTHSDLAINSLTNTGSAIIRDNTVLSSVNVVDNRGQMTIAGTLDSSLDNAAGAGTALAGGMIDGNVGNLGTISGSGEITGTLINDSRVHVGTNDVLTVHETINRQDLTVLGRLKTDLSNESGAGTTLAGGTIDGSIENNGILTGNGTITGALTNHTDAMLSGSLGDVVNNGQLSSTGALDVAQLLNTGNVDVASGTSLTTANPVRNESTMAIGGTVSGGIDNAIDTASIVLENGTLNGPLANAGSLTGTGTINGTLQNTNFADIGGTTTNVINSGELQIADNLSVSSLTNTGTVLVEDTDRIVSDTQVDNGGNMTIAGILDSSLSNSSNLALQGGTITNTITNTGNMSGRATVQGALSNDGNANLSGSFTDVVNNQNLETNDNLELTQLTNNGTARIEAGHTLTSASDVINHGSLTVDGALAGNLENISGGNVALNDGTITGDLTNYSGSQAQLAGTVDGDLINLGGNVSLGQTASVTDNLLVTGSIRNVATNPTDAADLPDPGNKGVMTVANDTMITARGGSTNEADATLNIEGTLTGNVSNSGIYKQTGTLDGSLLTTGEASLAGRVSGDVAYADGSLNIADGMQIGGTLDLWQNYSVTDNTKISAAKTQVNQGITLSLGGSIVGGVTSAGTITLTDTAAAIEGTLQNNGTIDLRDSSTDTTLTLAGMSGNGSVLMDISTGAAPRADKIIMFGGSTTGNVHLSFNSLSPQTGAASIGQRITLLDVDESFGSANNFTYTFDDLSTASERIVYSVDQVGDFGNLTLVSQVNPAIGSMFANVTLVQSLIGSVINRPTSPYVTGLAVDYGDKPCGIGGWGRAIGGSTTVEGDTNNQVSILKNRISSSYYGMQGGVDLACFDDRYAGWNMTFGVLGGVNIGDSRQPIYSINGRNSQATTGILSSITNVDFQQNYGGVYATGSKGRWTADLQFRVENTDFELENTPVIGSGLGIQDSEFSSKGTTLSGAIAYSWPVKNTGWVLSPNMGFSWSKYSTDSIRFDDGFLLEFDDSERQIGFVGASIGKTFIQLEENSALHSFATATYYNDFADKAVSRLSNDSLTGFTTQVMTSDNLKSYGEVSIGANYVKVLDPGSSGRPRQFSTSARIDGRFGDSIESVGVTGQLRWQF